MPEERPDPATLTAGSVRVRMTPSSPTNSAAAPDSSDSDSVWLAYLEVNTPARVRAYRTDSDLVSRFRAALQRDRTPRSEWRTRLLEIARLNLDSEIGWWAALAALMPEDLGNGNSAQAERDFEQFKRLHHVLLALEDMDAAETMRSVLGLSPGSAQEESHRTWASVCASSAMARASSLEQFEYWARLLAAQHSDTVDGTQALCDLSRVIKTATHRKAMDEWIAQRQRHGTPPPTGAEKDIFEKGVWARAGLEAAQQVLMYPNSDAVALGDLGAAVTNSDPGSPVHEEARILALQIMIRSSDWTPWLKDLGLVPLESRPEDVVAWRELWRAQNPLHPIWADPRVAESEGAKKFIQALLAQADWAAWLGAHHPDWNAGSPPSLEMLMAARKAWVAEQGAR